MLDITKDTTSADFRSLKAKLKSTWEAGDYGVFATYLESGALEFFERLNLKAGTRLLDLACGAGQLTLPAARKGIDVTGLDLAENLVAQARMRASAEGLHVRIDQGDAEALPYANESFDVVMSLIGAMFAPRPELVASEMIRVCKSGGRIVMGNWTSAGHVGQMFKVIARYSPPPPFPSPLLWGDESVCRQRLAAGIKEVRFARRLYPMVYPFGPDQVVDFFIEYYGPVNRVFDSLSEAARSAFRMDLAALWRQNNRATDGTTSILSEYLEVEATRA